MYNTKCWLIIREKNLFLERTSCLVYHEKKNTYIDSSNNSLNYCVHGKLFQSLFPEMRLGRAHFQFPRSVKPLYSTKIYNVLHTGSTLARIPYISHLNSTSRPTRRDDGGVQFFDEGKSLPSFYHSEPSSDDKGGGRHHQS